MIPDQERLLWLPHLSMIYFTKMQWLVSLAINVSKRLSLRENAPLSQRSIATSMAPALKQRKLWVQVSAPQPATPQPNASTNRPNITRSAKKKSSKKLKEANSTPSALSSLRQMPTSREISVLAEVRVRSAEAVLKATQVSHAAWSCMRTTTDLRIERWS